jgi:hypothetical protein
MPLKPPCDGPRLDRRGPHERPTPEARTTLAALQREIAELRDRVTALETRLLLRERLDAPD